MIRRLALGALGGTLGALLGGATALLAFVLVVGLLAQGGPHGQSGLGELLPLALLMVAAPGAIGGALLFAFPPRNLAGFLAAALLALLGAAGWGTIFFEKDPKAGAGISAILAGPSLVLIALAAWGVGRIFFRRPR